MQQSLGRMFKPSNKAGGFYLWIRQNIYRCIEWCIRNIGRVKQCLPFRGRPGYHDCAQLGIYLLDIGRSRHTMCKLRIPRHRVGTTDSGEKSLPVHVIVNQHAEIRSEENTSELQSLMRNSSAVFCL